MVVDNVFACRTSETVNSGFVFLCSSGCVPEYFKCMSHLTHVVMDHAEVLFSLCPSVCIGPILSSAATLGVSKHSLDLLCNVIFIEETVYQGIIHIKGHAQLHQ